MYVVHPDKESHVWLIWKEEAQLSLYRSLGYSCVVLVKANLQFLRKSFYSYFYRVLCKTMSCDVHLEQKSESFIMRDHSMTIHVKIEFNQNISFWKKNIIVFSHRVLNLKLCPVEATILDCLPKKPRHLEEDHSLKKIKFNNFEDILLNIVKSIIK